jgi:hypothetical protein
MHPVPQQTSLNEQGATHFVEVERDVDKNLEQRQAKWLCRLLLSSVRKS